MIEIFTAKTVEEAKEIASGKFNAPQSEIQFTVMEEPRKSLFGKLKGEAKVKAEYVPMMKQTPIKKAVSASPITAAPAEKTPVVETPVATAPVVETPAATAPIVEKALEGSQNISTQETVEENGFSKENEQKINRAVSYISSILREMHLPDACVVTEHEGGAILNFDGDGSGTLIGRRGETLDALQYLASMISNKGEKEYFRISIDSCGYRDKRKDTLTELACKIAKSVVRTGRATTLEPMNPYERRIIHSAVSEIEGVASHSVGEEPYRKVIITSTDPAKQHSGADRKESSRRNGSGPRSRNNTNSNRDRRPKNYDGPKKLDLQTSFEKDYKRPKPEDDIHAGLYGKIEF